MITRFDFAYMALTPIAAAYLGYKALRHGKYRESVPQMLGSRLKTEDPEVWKNGCVWIHAVSVGEVIAARAMLPLLRERFAPLPLLLTTVTETGQNQANSLPKEMVDAVRYYPTDFSWNVRKFVSVYRPRVLVLMETELWPNALRIFEDSGARIFVLNGKITPKSFRSYRRLRALFAEPLRRVHAYCMQTEDDAIRVRELTGRSENVFVTGNCKFDVAGTQVSEQRKKELLAMCGIEEGRPLVVVGSTHPGEEEIAIDAFRSIIKSVPDAALLLVPRHPERFDLVWQLLEHSGLTCRRLSSSSGGESVAAVLVDRMGILSDLYAAANVAVVAGSLVPGIGGHNILEPAVHGIPVVYGPYMNKQPDMVRILGTADAGVQGSGDELAAAVSDLLVNPEKARELGRRGRDAVLANRGSAARNMEIIEKFVEDIEQQ